MKTVCVTVGRRHDGAIVEAIDEYSVRLQRYGGFEWRLVPSTKGKMDVAEIKRVESVTIAAQLKNDDHVVLLDEDGAQLTSSGLASILESLDAQSVKRVVYIIGGAYGVTDELKQRADTLWALSKLTFPHQLVRLILAEQLYRANTIRHGEPYHHE